MPTKKSTDSEEKAKTSVKLTTKKAAKKKAAKKASKKKVAKKAAKPVVMSADANQAAALAAARCSVIYRRHAVCRTGSSVLGRPFRICIWDRRRRRGSSLPPTASGPCGASVRAAAETGRQGDHTGAGPSIGWADGSSTWQLHSPPRSPARMVTAALADAATENRFTTC